LAVRPILFELIAIGRLTKCEDQSDTTRNRDRSDQLGDFLFAPFLILPSSFILFQEDAGLRGAQTGVTYQTTQ
jgi:hypothetical protein